MTVAFYSPMRAPETGKPAGDRAMSSAFFAMLTRIGLAPHVASPLRCYDGVGDRAEQERLRDLALAEADRLASRYAVKSANERPRLWFTYHCYYKAPDWIGPRVAAALKIPYVIAEASHAPKRKGGPWSLACDAAESAIRSADAVLAMTPHDRACLEPLAKNLHDFPPFIDSAPFVTQCRRTHEGPLRIATVAMLRPGKKVANFPVIADVLGRLGARDWRYAIAGDGPAAENVRAVFEHLPRERVDFRGRLNHGDVAAFLGEADIYLWPGRGEAYGLSYLEAQASGLPVVAWATAGVPAVVKHGITGLLAKPDDEAALAAALARLIDDFPLRHRLGAAAQRFVATERDTTHATARLDGILRPLL